MANTIPCPNPTCTHDFSMAELQAAAQLLCPKCGFRMQGKGTAQPKPPAPPPKPAAPPSKPPAPAKVALATPVQPKPAAPSPAPAKVAPATPVQTKPAPPSPPQAAPVPTPSNPPPPTAPTATPTSEAAPNTSESVADGMFFNPDVDASAGALVRTGSKPKKPFNWMRALVTMFAVGFAGCIVIIAFALLVMFLPAFEGFRNSISAGDTYIGKIRNSKNESEKVYKLVLPRSDWAVDNEIKTRFEAHAAWKWRTSDYDFWFALVVQDFGSQKPRDAEMLRVGIEKLENHFGEDMELAAKAESVKFGGVQAQKLQFRGVVNEARWLGECYMFFNNGIAYWLFVASPKDDVLAYFVDELQEKHFFVQSERRGWREQPPPVVTFSSSDNKVEVTAPKGVWEKANPKDDDENGVLLLSGRFVREKDNRKNALLIVFTLKKETDLKASLKAARDYLDAKEKAVNDNYKLVHAPDVVPGQTDIGSVEDVGNKRGRMVNLKLQFGDEPQRYFLLSVINEADVGYAVLCSCDWKSRQIWRQDFLDVLRTMRVK